MQCPNAVFMLSVLNSEKGNFSPFRYNAPKTATKPNAPRTPLTPRAFADMAELVCKLAFAVFVDVPPAV
jgi:hypothetical protein